MKVRFYGVRGSIASAGDETRRYGGNTPCMAVDALGKTLVFDAGTGIRKLGRDLGCAGVEAHLFLSHLHWDHIQGFPFFTPAFVPGNRVHVWGAERPGAPTRDFLAAQMTAPNFPVGIDVMRADLRFFDVPWGERILLGPVVVRHTAVDHPNGCVAWRVDCMGKSVVYATDLELSDDMADGGLLRDGLVELARGADLLVFDAMYTPEEYEGKAGPSRRGWGHSTFEEGAKLAESAGVKELCLFHHDPSHDDDMMDALAARARRRFARTIVAQEGMEIDL